MTTEPAGQPEAPAPQNVVLVDVQVPIRSMVYFLCRLVLALLIVGFLGFGVVMAFGLVWLIMASIGA